MDVLLCARIDCCTDVGLRDGLVHESLCTANIFVNVVIFSKSDAARDGLHMVDLMGGLMSHGGMQWPVLCGSIPKRSSAELFLSLLLSIHFRRQEAIVCMVSKRLDAGLQSSEAC